MAKRAEKDNLILKIREGELFKFFDTETRSKVTVGSSRLCDICIKSQMLQAEQVALIK